MCGDGKYWRGMIYRMCRAAGPELCRGVLCSTKRNPIAYMRVIGGKLRRVEYSFDFETRKSETLWFIFITWDDTKEKGGSGIGDQNDDDHSSGDGAEER